MNRRRPWWGTALSPLVAVLVIFGVGVPVMMVAMLLFVPKAGHP